MAATLHMTRRALTRPFVLATAVLLLVLVAWTAFAPPAQAQSGQTLYGAAGTDSTGADVYSVNTSDGSTVDTGNDAGNYTFATHGMTAIGDMVYIISANIFGFSWHKTSIRTWDPTNGTATTYLELQDTINGYPYSIAASGSVLHLTYAHAAYKVDTAAATPTPTLITSNYRTGAPANFGNYAIHGSAFVNSLWYVVVNDRLWTMSTSDGSLTLVGPTGMTGGTVGNRSISSMASSGDALYGVTNDKRLYKFNTSTGAATRIGAGTLPGTFTGLVVHPAFSGPDCTATLAPAANLGTLGNASGSTIVHSGTMVRNIDDIPCGNEGTEYFTFSLTEGGGVGFSTNGLTVTYHILEGTAYGGDLADCGGGANTCENTERGDFGGVFEVTGASTTYMGYIEGGFGADSDYALTVRRLVPQFVEALTTSESIVSTWDVGAPSEFLKMRVDHRPQKAANWTTGTDYSGPAAGDQVVEDTIDGLDLDDYALRAVFRHAPDSQGGEGVASTFPQVWGFPPGNMAIEANRVGDLDVYRYSVIATWHFPQVRFTDWDDDEVDWSFLLRYNDTETDVGQTRRAVFFVDEPGGLKVDVRARFACPDSSTETDECKLRVRGWVSSYAGDDDHDYFTLPQGETVLTPRSDAASAYIDPDPRMVETELIDESAIPPVVDAINGVLSIAGVAPESRRPEVWAFFLCLIGGLAIGGGLGFATNVAGYATASLFAGAFAFFLWWSLLGPEWFGIPPFFAYGTVAAPILATGIFIVARARL